jgi:DeoR family transcriptional regulator, fructose operon transcriptional repressor
MSISSRQNEILEILQDTGECTIDFLANKFSTSGMTVRRDLQALSDQGRVIRTHGGARLASGVNFEFAFLQRTKLAQKEKRAIGQLAAGLIQDGQSVMLDSGTTTLAIAEHLKLRRDIKVVTTSLPIASMLQFNESIEINLLGGQLRAGAPDLSGTITAANLDMIRTDLAFIGADAIDDSGTAFTDWADLAMILSKMATGAKYAYVVADSSKLDRTALWKLFSLQKLGGLITDYKAPADFVNRLTKAGVKVHRTQKSRG